MAKFDLMHLTDIGDGCGFWISAGAYDQLASGKTLTLVFARHEQGDLAIDSRIAENVWRCEWQRPSSPFHGRSFELILDGGGAIFPSSAFDHGSARPPILPMLVKLAS